MWLWKVLSTRARLSPPAAWSARVYSSDAALVRTGVRPACKLKLPMWRVGAVVSPRGQLQWDRAVPDRSSTEDGVRLSFTVRSNTRVLTRREVSEGTRKALAIKASGG
jgi:hypothetical protein